MVAVYLLVWTLERIIHWEIQGRIHAHCVGVGDANGYEQLLVRHAKIKWSNIWGVTPQGLQHQNGVMHRHYSLHGHNEV